MKIIKSLSISIFLMTCSLLSGHVYKIYNKTGIKVGLRYTVTPQDKREYYKFMEKDAMFRIDTGHDCLRALYVDPFENPDYQPLKDDWVLIGRCYSKDYDIVVKKDKKGKLKKNKKGLIELDIINHK